MAIDPTVLGPEGDDGTDGVWGTITNTLGNLIRNGGDYLHEKFLTPHPPKSDEPFYKEWGGRPSDTQSMQGKGPEKQKYRGFEFTNIAIIWGVGIVAAVGLIYLAVRKR